MARKLVFACLVAALVLAGAITPASATPPVVRLPFTHPSGGGTQVVPTTPFSVNRDYRNFQVVFQPVQGGYTSPDGTAMTDVITFKNHLFAAVSDQTSGLRLFVSSDGTNWVPITPSVLVKNTCYMWSWDWIEYRGQLYMAVNDGGSCGLPGLVMRTANGKDWEIVFKDTSGNNVDKLGVFNGWIYLNTLNCSPGMIWRSPTGEPGTWTQAGPDIGSIVCSWSPFVTFKGYIYTSGTDYNNWPNPVFVLRSADGLNWENVGQGMVDDSANYLDGDLVVYKGQLYLCTHWWGWEGPYAGGRIYRTKDGVKWELVVQDGFGNPDPSGIDSLFVYQNKLAAFAFDSVTGITYVYASVTGNTESWTLVNQNGMGPNTSTARGGQTFFKGDLYVGTGWVSNPSDTSVYKMVKP